MGPGTGVPPQSGRTVPVKSGSSVPVRPAVSLRARFAIAEVNWSVRNRPEQLVQLRRPKEQVAVRLAGSPLVDGNQASALKLLDVIARLAIGDAEARTEGLEGWVATGVLAGEAEQARIQYGANAP